jgi:hypothetical protein
MLDISYGKNVRPKGSWIAACAFCPPLFGRGLAIGHIACDVISQFGNIVSHHSSVLSRTILLIFWKTRHTAVLHAESLVSSHNFLSFLLFFNNCFRPCISYFRCIIVAFMVDSLYAEAIEPAKSGVALSASLKEWTWIFADMGSEAKLWNSS